MEKCRTDDKDDKEQFSVLDNSKLSSETENLEFPYVGCLVVGDKTSHNMKAVLPNADNDSATDHKESQRDYYEETDKPNDNDAPLCLKRIPHAINMNDASSDSTSEAIRRHIPCQPVASLGPHLKPFKNKCRKMHFDFHERGSPGSNDSNDQNQTPSHSSEEILENSLIEDQNKSSEISPLPKRSLEGNNQIGEEFVTLHTEQTEYTYTDNQNPYQGSVSQISNYNSTVAKKSNLPSIGYQAHNVKNTGVIQFRNEEIVNQRATTPVVRDTTYSRSTSSKNADMNKEPSNKIAKDYNPRDCATPPVPKNKRWLHFTPPNLKNPKSFNSRHTRESDPAVLWRGSEVRTPEQLKIHELVHSTYQNYKNSILNSPVMDQNARQPGNSLYTVPRADGYANSSPMLLTSTEYDYPLNVNARSDTNFNWTPTTWENRNLQIVTQPPMSPRSAAWGNSTQTSWETGINNASSYTNTRFEDNYNSAYANWTNSVYIQPAHMSSRPAQVYPIPPRRTAMHNPALAGAARWECTRPAHMSSRPGERNNPVYRGRENNAHILPAHMSSRSGDWNNPVYRSHENNAHILPAHTTARSPAEFYNSATRWQANEYIYPSQMYPRPEELHNQLQVKLQTNRSRSPLPMSPKPGEWRNAETRTRDSFSEVFECKPKMPLDVARPILNTNEYHLPLSAIPRYTDNVHTSYTTMMNKETIIREAAVPRSTTHWLPAYTTPRIRQYDASTPRHSPHEKRSYSPNTNVNAQGSFPTSPIDLRCKISHNSSFIDSRTDAPYTQCTANLRKSDKPQHMQVGPRNCRKSPKVFTKTIRPTDAADTGSKSSFNPSYVNTKARKFANPVPEPLSRTRESVIISCPHTRSTLEMPRVNVTPCHFPIPPREIHSQTRESVNAESTGPRNIGTPYPTEQKNGMFQKPATVISQGRESVNYVSNYNSTRQFMKPVTLTSTIRVTADLDYTHIKTTQSNKPLYTNSKSTNTTAVSSGAIHSCENTNTSHLKNIESNILLDTNSRTQDSLVPLDVNLDNIQITHENTIINIKNNASTNGNTNSLPSSNVNVHVEKPENTTPNSYVCVPTSGMTNQKVPYYHSITLTADSYTEKTVSKEAVPFIKEKTPKHPTSVPRRNNMETVQRRSCQWIKDMQMITNYCSSQSKLHKPVINIRPRSYTPSPSLDGLPHAGENTPPPLHYRYGQSGFVPPSVETNTSMEKERNAQVMPESDATLVTDSNRKFQESNASSINIPIHDSGLLPAISTNADRHTVSSTVLEESNERKLLPNTPTTSTDIIKPQ